MGPRAKYILGSVGLLAVAAAVSRRGEKGYDPFPDDGSFHDNLEARRTAIQAVPRVRRHQARRPERRGSGPYGWQNQGSARNCGCDGS